MRRSRVVTLMHCLALSTPAIAQIGSTSGAITLAYPNGNTYNGTQSVLIEVWMSFDNLFAWTHFSGGVNSSDITSEWGLLTSAYATLPNTSVGVSSGGAATGIEVGQIHFPPVFYANTANPILIWSGEWTTTDLTPRIIEVTTATLLALGLDHSGHFANIVYSEASAQIQVIPAPFAFSTLALAGGLACSTRRTRERSVL